MDTENPFCFARRVHSPATTPPQDSEGEDEEEAGQGDIDSDKQNVPAGDGNDIDDSANLRAEPAPTQNLTIIKTSEIRTDGPI